MVSPAGNSIHLPGNHFRHHFSSEPDLPTKIEGENDSNGYLEGESGGNDDELESGIESAPDLTLFERERREEEMKIALNRMIEKEMESLGERDEDLWQLIAEKRDFNTKNTLKSIKRLYLKYRNSKRFVSEHVPDFHQVDIEGKSVSFYTSAKGNVFVLERGVLGTGQYKETYRAFKLFGPKVKPHTDRSKLEKVLSKPKTNDLFKPNSSGDLIRESAANDRLSRKAKEDPSLLSHVSVNKIESPERSILVTTSSFLAPGGDLNSWVKDKAKYEKIVNRLPDLCKQLAVGVQQLHALDILHRDIKLDNVLVYLNDVQEVDVLKLTDFGKAMLIDKGEQKFPGLYLSIIPPEIYKECVVDALPYTDLCQSPAVDVYQLGVLYYQLFAGIPNAEMHLYPPVFTATPLKEWTNEQKQQYLEAKQHPENWPKMDTVSEDTRKFILKMLDVDPSNRPSINQVVEFFQ